MKKFAPLEQNRVRQPRSGGLSGKAAPPATAKGVKLSPPLSPDEEAALKKHIEVHPEHKDIYVAVREAFGSARRQLQDYVKQMRGKVKTHPQNLRHGFGTSGP